MMKMPVIVRELSKKEIEKFEKGTISTDDYVIGGGISGLLASFYLDIPVIEKGETKIPSPFFLWDTRETRELIEKLELPVKPRTIKIGHFYQGKFVSPTEQIQKIYSVKMGKESSMSEGKTELKILDFNVSEFIAKLKENVQIINDEIVAIKMKKIIGKKDVYLRDKLISTIPLPELLNILNIKSNLEYSPIIFITAQTYEECIWNNEYDYIYLLDEDIPFYRMTKKEKPVCVLESLVPVLYSRQFEISTLKIKILKYGKILGGTVPDLFDYKIKLLGRFGEWNSDIRTHDIIKKIKSWKNQKI